MFISEKAIRKLNAFRAKNNPIEEDENGAAVTDNADCESINSREASHEDEDLPTDNQLN
jgi:hypothetical protein